MDKAFFASKYFVISAVVASLILGAAAAAYTIGGVGGPRISSGGGSGCEAPALAGAPLASEPEVVLAENGRHRTETYLFDAASYEGGALDACVTVGDVLVEAAPGDLIEVVFTVRGGSADAVRATAVEAAFHAAGRALSVGAWHAETRGTWRGEGSEVDLVVRLPALGPWDVAATSDVGDVHARTLLVRELDLRTSVGDVLARALDLQGNASLRADVGDVSLAAESVQSGTVSVITNVGEVDISLPSRADVGYHASASASVGSVTLRLGPTDSYDSHADGPGETETARSAGYASKPTQVRVEAASDVGDITVTVQGAG